LICCTSLVSRFIILFYNLEFGIYCELNLPDCVTYAFPASSTEENVSYLLQSIHIACQILREERKSSETSSIGMEESRLETLVPQPLEFSFIEGKFWDNSISVQILQNDVVTFNSNLIGKISAETVNILYNC
jgi:hypothetical protein